jgi:hypothetical protein
MLRTAFALLLLLATAPPSVGARAGRRSRPVVVTRGAGRRGRGEKRPEQAAPAAGQASPLQEISLSETRLREAEARLKEAEAGREAADARFSEAAELWRGEGVRYRATAANRMREASAAANAAADEVRKAEAEVRMQRLRLAALKQPRAPAD